VEQAVDRVIPDWHTSVPADDNDSVNRSCQHVEVTTHAKGDVRRGRAEHRDPMVDTLAV
jgi:hypothetical protein